ncbi:hypothetical protein IMSAGC004_03163 [Bacteroidaceae bacterium]|nr:hypothetical protein IMSAGC004_03163 [Bacteroidaceae bacterium]
MIIHCLPIMSSAQQIDIFEPAILECEYYKSVLGMRGLRLKSLSAMGHGNSVDCQD